jgi:hypothetical protein
LLHQFWFKKLKKETHWAVGRASHLVSYWLAALLADFHPQLMQTSGDTVRNVPNLSPLLLRQAKWLKEKKWKKLFIRAKTFDSADV